MTTLGIPVKSSVELVCSLFFAFYFSTLCSAHNHHTCSEHACTHDLSKTMHAAGFEMRSVLNFSKKISDGDLQKIISAMPPAGRQYRLRTIVLDAGHGGKDAGCSGKDSKEKNLTLEYVLSLGAMIEEKYPDINVIYTRKNDVFVELYERANIANRAKADLFISIHCNWNPNTSPYGTETYVLGLHRAKDNLEVAKRENSSIFLESDYKKNYDGFDPNSPEGNIIFSMCQNAHLDQSISIAEKIEKEFSVRSGRKSRGVRQAGFLVLRATSMPAILVETGFLSNQKEEDYMISSKGKKEIVQNIFHGFEKYKAAVEFFAGDDAPLLASGKPVSGQHARVQPVSYPVSQDDDNSVALLDDTQDKKQAGPSMLIEPRPVQQTEPAIEAGSETASVKIEICVQLEVTRTVQDMSEKKWEPFDNIIARSENNMLKYQVVCNSMAEAKQVKIKAKNEGFPEAFICAYRDGERISLDEISGNGHIGLK